MATARLTANPVAIEMPRRCRLFKPAIIDGQPRRPGYEFTLADNDPGPCEHVIVSHDRVDVNNDNARLIGETRAVPLYVELAPPAPDPDIPAPHIIKRLRDKFK